MSKKISRGICQICGVNGELSFEHIPPRKAFNDRPVRRINFKDIDDIELGPNAKPKGKIEQKGQGDYTLCPSCNNNTGSWYGDSFIVWCYQAMDFLQLTLENDSQETLQLGQQTYNIYPLRVLKQIISMFFSVSGKNFHSRHEGLVKFILNKEAKYLPPKYRFFIYYSLGDKFRSLGGTALYNVNNNKTITLSEIAYPPFGYVMTISSEPPDNRLTDISHFARYGYEESVSIPLKLFLLPTHLPIPGDYRELTQIREKSG